jgi:hypothetical protein
VICTSVKAVDPLLLDEVFVITSVLLTVVERFSSTEIKVPKAGLNWENSSGLFHSVSVAGTGVLVLMGP